MGSSARGALLGPLGMLSKEQLFGGDAKEVGTANLMTKEQQKLLKGALGSVGGDFGNVLLELLQGGGTSGAFEDQFQKGVVDPTMQTYNQDILPALEQRYADIGAGSSSALNQALVRSSDDLTNLLAGQRIGYQGQQQATRQNAQNSALQAIMSLMGQKSFQPIVQGPTEGLIKPLIGAAGQVGAGAMMSSEKVKENIRDYKKSLDVIDNIDVKQYDYIVEVPGKQKDRVGLIAEDLPCELTADVNGVLGVDLYGLVSILVNCVKDLSANVKEMKKQIQALEA